MPPLTRQSRLPIIAMAIGTVLWLVWFSGVAFGGFKDDVDGNTLGADHSIFHTAGELVRRGEADLLYTVDGFNEALTDVRGRLETKPTPHFLHPPAVAHLFAPISLAPRTFGWLGLGIVGFGALVLALRLVGVANRWAPLLAALSLPAWLNWRLGQLAPFWALIFAAVYRLIRNDRQAVAGVVSGLLALKPQFGLAVALWWVLDWARYRVALAWSAATALVITALSVAMTPGAFAGFRDAALGAVTDAKFPIGYSLNDTVLGLVPEAPELLVALVIGAIGVGALTAVVRHNDNDVPLQFAATAAVALWVTPHLIAYDWMLLAVAVGALWSARPGQRLEWLQVACVVSLWSAAAWIVALLGRDWFNLRLELAALGLAVIAVVAYKRLAAPGSTSARTINAHV